MVLSSELKEFIQAHIDDNTNKLLLSASKFPDIDMPFAVDQIIIRRQLKDKLPTWFRNNNLIFPSRIAAEQCSSEPAATYKQQLIKGDTVCDLSGGLGVDSWYFAQKAQKVVYIEQSAEYCKAAESNFKALKTANIEVIHADSSQIIDTLHADTFYMDPDRRSAQNKRLFALADCSPNIVELKGALLEKAQRIIVKLSPMADVSETIRLLPETTEIHIVSIKNECKELLFVLENQAQTEINTYTVNYTSEGDIQRFQFPRSMEKTATTAYANSVKTYVYEPNSSILKSGAFKLISAVFGIEKLHPNSHLYTSDTWISDFPGRSFIVHDIADFSGKMLKTLNRTYPQANISVRNFPLSVDEIRKKSKIKEGGDLYLFCTTIADEHKIIIVCRKNDQHRVVIRN